MLPVSAEAADKQSPSSHQSTRPAQQATRSPGTSPATRSPPPSPATRSPLHPSPTRSSPPSPPPTRYPSPPATRSKPSHSADTRCLPLQSGKKEAKYQCSQVRNKFAADGTHFTQGKKILFLICGQMKLFEKILNFSQVSTCISLRN